MNEEQARERRTLLVLTDAMVASLWVAVVLLALTLVSALPLVAMRPTLVSLVAQLSGVTPGVMAIIWVCAVVMLKVTAISFAAMAFGLWVWKRRLERRMAEAHTG